MVYLHCHCGQYQLSFAGPFRRFSNYPRLSKPQTDQQNLQLFEDIQPNVERFLLNITILLHSIFCFLGHHKKRTKRTLILISKRYQNLFIRRGQFCVGGSLRRRAINNRIKSEFVSAHFDTYMDFQMLCQTVSMHFQSFAWACRTILLH